MFLGIDLGTSNSVIAGVLQGKLRLFKTADGADALPSAIFVDKRGVRLYGRRAVEQSLLAPDNLLQGFKRLMGTATPLEIAEAHVRLSPEECSADIIKQLLAQAVVETGQDKFEQVIITIPAAFNQMQCEATLRAAELAGINAPVKLLQEPVAAAIAAAKGEKIKGQFLIYDLGGGTFDLALARADETEIKIVTNQGISMLGGRDFDRRLVQEIIKPWLQENFDLPDDFTRQPAYKRLLRVAALAAEKAKIDLSSRESASIFASDDEVRTEDASGADIFLDIKLTRAQFEKIIEDTVARTIAVAQQLLEAEGLKAADIDRLVFIGGPSKIPYVRQTVSQQLGIAADLSLDPMTTVAIGAAYYAAQQAGVAVVPATTAVADSGAKIAEVPVAKAEPVAPAITIPAAKTIAVKVRTTPEGEAEPQNILLPILQAGTVLPATGVQEFTAAEELQAGAGGFLSFELFQLEFAERMELNLCIGAFRLASDDLPTGAAVQVGDKIIFRWQMNDSGILTAKVQVPRKNAADIELNTPRFYAPQAGERSYAGPMAVAFAAAMLQQGEDELNDLSAALGPHQPRDIELLRFRLAEQRTTLADAAADPEQIGYVTEEARFIRQDIARQCRRHAAAILQRRVGKIVAAFNKSARAFANADEQANFTRILDQVQALISTATVNRAAALADATATTTSGLPESGMSVADWYKAERRLIDLRQIFYAAAWRDPEYVKLWLQQVEREPFLFPDQEEYAELLAAAKAAAGKPADLQKIMQKIMAARVTLGASDSAADLASVAGVIG